MMGGCEEELAVWNEFVNVHVSELLNRNESAKIESFLILGVSFVCI
jgi:hypothetical protein